MIEILIDMLVELGGMRQHLRRIETEAKGALDSSGLIEAMKENENRIKIIKERILQCQSQN